jgi:predicted nucleic acid-binding Zn ribbon protein
MADEDEFDAYTEQRQRRIKVIAWVVIVALILVGGGATVLSLLFG